MPSYNHLKHEYRRIKFVIENKIYNSPISEMIRQRQKCQKWQKWKNFHNRTIGDNKRGPIFVETKKGILFLYKKKKSDYQKKIKPTTISVLSLNQTDYYYYYKSI